jgi:16S rRNA (guanine527-N7)-methyltransferase
VEEIGIANAQVVCERAETWATDEGREGYDVVTARAVGRLATLAEIASPLLIEGGHLIAWKGKRDEEEEAEVARAVARTAVEPVEVRAVGPYAGSKHRHLHLLRKIGPTPNDLPRRPGMAKKKPFGSEQGV